MAFLNIKISRLLPLLSLPLMLVGGGCEKEYFDPNINTESVVVINAVITAGDTVQASVTHSWLWTDNKNSPEDLQLPDADVSIYVNDKFYSKMTYRKEPSADPYTPGKYYFLSNYVATPGDVVRIVASHPKYGTAEGSTEIPLPVAFASHDIHRTDLIPNNDSSNGNWWDYEVKGNITLPISDPGDQQNFYQIRITNAEGSLRKGTYNYLPPNFDQESDPIFQEHISTFEYTMGGGSYDMIFSDRKFNGGKYNLNLRYNAYVYNYSGAEWAPKQIPNNSTKHNANNIAKAEEREPIVEIQLTTLSKSLYQYWLSCEARNGFQGGLSQIGMADITWTKSNVSSGAGIIAARTPSSITLPLAAFFPTDINP